VNAALTRVLDKVDRLLGKELEPAKPEPASSATPSSEQALVDAMGEMRKLLQRTGAGFAAGAAALLAGLGYAQLHQVFPIPPAHRSWIAAAALAGVLLALVGAIVFAGRFFSAQRRILITTRESDRDADINGEDEEIRAKFFRDAAVTEHAPSLEAIEFRARRLERIARVTGDSELKSRLESEAKRLTAVYRLAMYRSAARILERRSRDAFKGSRYWALVTAAGIVLAFAAADYAKGERDRIGLLKECEAAITAGADEACDPVRSASERRAAKDRDADAKTAEDSALSAARVTFENTGSSRLELVEACSRVLFATPGLKESEDAARAAVVSACVQLVGGS
jgi:hypothetical protein